MAVIRQLDQHYDKQDKMLECPAADLSMSISLTNVKLIPIYIRQGQSASGHKVHQLDKCRADSNIYKARSISIRTEGASA